jgi:hypothetical protein
MTKVQTSMKTITDTLAANKNAMPADPKQLEALKAAVTALSTDSAAWAKELATPPAAPAGGAAPVAAAPK